MDGARDLTTRTYQHARPAFDVIEGHATGLTPPGYTPQQNGIDIRRIFLLLLRSSPFILVTLALGLAAGFAALTVLPPHYTSTIAILIDPKRPDSLGANAAFANLVVDSSKVASVELVLTSSELLGKVVRSAHLDQDPAYGAATLSLPHRWLMRLAPGFFPPLADNAEARQSRAIFTLGRNIRTGRVGMTYVINVTVSAPSAVQAQALARSVVNAYVSDQIETKITAAQRDTDWLTAQLARMRHTLSKSEASVEDIRRRYGFVETDHGAGATLDRQSATDINTQLQLGEDRLATSRGRWEQARRLLDSHGSLDELPEVAASQVIAGLRSQQADVRRRLTRLKAIYTDQYSEVTRMQADLDVLDSEVAAETQRIVAGLRHNFEIDLASRDALRQRLAALVSATSTADQADGRIQLKQAQRVLEASQLAYTAALAQLHGLELQPARQDAEIRVISDAGLPDRPSFPKPILFLGGGGALGLLGGTAVALLLSLLRKRVEDANATCRLLALPMLAAVPRLSRADLQRCGSAPDYLVAHPISSFADSLRMLRGALRTSQGMPKVVQVTSSNSGEGKSVLSASLAVSAASAGMKTAIVDLDFYHPSIARFFGMKQDARGVADLLAAGTVLPEAGFENFEQVWDKAWAQTVVQAWGPGLKLGVIGAGTRQTPLSDRLDGFAFSKLLSTLRDQYDFIVLDTPPILAVADGVLIARHVDATIMVCAWRSTPQKLLERAVRVLRLASVPLAGIVVNRVPAGSAETYPRGYYAKWRLEAALPAPTQPRG